jgi:RNA polymerase sigma-70 factor (ECF subfamily)
MEPVEHPQASADFEAEALPFLPNVARFARLLTGDAADADDLTQETFLRAYAKWSTYRRGTDCRKWLFTICRHIHLRTQQRVRHVVALDDPERELAAVRALFDAAWHQGLDGLFDRLDIAPALHRALEALPAEYRDALILVDIEGWAYNEAAELSGVPVGTIRSRLYRARRSLQESLINYAQDLGFAVPARSGEGSRP